MRFTGPSQQIGISLPAELVAYLKQRKQQEGVTISAQCRLALENDIMDRAATKLVDTRVEYNSRVPWVGNSPEMPTGDES